MIWLRSWSKNLENENKKVSKEDELVFKGKNDENLSGKNEFFIRKKSGLTIYYLTTCSSLESFVPQSDISKN